VEVTEDLGAAKQEQQVSPYDPGNRWVALPDTEDLRPFLLGRGLLVRRRSAWQGPALEWLFAGCRLYETARLRDTVGLASSHVCDVVAASPRVLHSHRLPRTADTTLRGAFTGLRPAANRDGGKLCECVEWIRCSGLRNRGLCEHRCRQAQRQDYTRHSTISLAFVG
jgi:hypothetical protein